MPHTETPVSPESPTRRGSASLEVRLSFGLPLSIDRDGIKAPFYTGINSADVLFVSWAAVHRVRRIKNGNPFEAPRSKASEYEKGLFVEDDGGNVLILDAFEPRFAEIEDFVRTELKQRWNEVFRDDEIVAIRSGPEAQAPLQLRPEFLLMKDPLKSARGNLVSVEPNPMHKDHKRRWLSRSLVYAGIAWTLVAFGSLGIFFSNLFPGIYARPLITGLVGAGAIALIASAMSFKRAKSLGPIRLYDQGIEIPAIWGKSELQIIPFHAVVNVTRATVRHWGEVLQLHTVPWLDPFVIPANFPGIIDVLQKQGKIPPDSARLTQ